MALQEQAGRKERRRAERRARKEHRQKEQERRSSLAWVRKPLAYLVGALLVGAAGYWAYHQWASGMPGQFVASMGNRHITTSAIGVNAYNSDPPTSGPHLPSIASWGIHENPIPKELQIHNLEDGGIVVQYNCRPQAEEECRTLVEKLAQIVKRYDHAILAPYPGMSHKIALTAWSRIDKFNDFDEKRIVRFIEAYIGLDHHARK
ncbi:MAG: DUF3105 domain-containing protein [Deltaproteobacteria bacterium]|nr:DUF3105 domain-containing protein [Deltaproteobacteria bacterium]